MSGNNEEIDNYAAQDLEIMNTIEATAYFWNSIEAIFEILNV